MAKSKHANKKLRTLISGIIIVVIGIIAAYISNDFDNKWYGIFLICLGVILIIHSIIIKIKKK